MKIDNCQYPSNGNRSAEIMEEAQAVAINFVSILGIQLKGALRARKQ